MIKTIVTSVFFKHTSVYFFTNILNAAIPFFLLPVMTAYLLPSDYGIVSLFGVISSVSVIFTNVNLHGAIERQFFQKDTILSSYIGTCSLLVFGVTILVTFISFAFKDFIGLQLQFPSEWIPIAVVGSFFSFFITAALTLFRLEMKPRLYAVFQILQGLCGAVLAIVLVVNFSMGWKGRLLSIMVVTICAGIIGFFVLLKKGQLKLIINKYYLKNALQFGLPLIPYALSGIVMTMMDKIIISSLLGISVTGVYTIGAQFAMIIAMGTSSFNSVWVGWLYGKLQENDFKKKILIVKATYVYFIVVILLCVLLAAIAPRILRLMVNKSYYGASEYVFWIGLGYALNGMYMMVGNYLFFAEKTSILAYIACISALANSFLTYFLVKLNGAVGAAQAVVLSNIVFFVFAWYFSAKIYPMPWAFWRCDESDNKKLF